MNRYRRTVTDVHVVDVQKRRQPTKHYVYVLNVKWSEATEFSIYRTYSMFFEFQAKLHDLFANQVPSLPGRFVFGRSEVVAEKRKLGISEFCKALIRLPPSIAHHDEVLAFFEAWPEDVMLQINFDTALKTNPFYSSVAEMRQSSTSGEDVDSPELYRAVATYRARSRTEVSFTSGQEIQVVEKNVNGWWMVIASEQEGRAPASYLEPVNHRPEEDCVYEDADSRDKTSYIVSSQYSAQGGDEIALEKGTKVEILQQTLDGWWRVRAEGKEGYFPSTFLKKMSLHRSKDGKAEEAVYGVFLPPPPRRDEIVNVDSIYSSVEHIKPHIPTRTRKRSDDSAIQAQRFSQPTQMDSEDDIFEYADLDTIKKREPDYAEVESSPAAIAQRRKKIQDEIAQLQLKESESPPTRRPNHRPSRLIRGNAPTRISPETPSTITERKRQQFGSEGPGSTDSMTSESDHDLYTVISDYVPEDDDGVTLKEGDTVEVDDIQDDWAYVRVPQGRMSGGMSKEGWAPAAFLRKKRKPKPNRPAPTLPSSKSLKPASKQQSFEIDEELEFTGPTIVRQNVSGVQKSRVEQSKDRSLSDDVIRIETTPAQQQPDVYVNTREYVNLAGDGSTATNVGGGKDQVHPYVNTPHRQELGREPDPREYVNTGPTSIMQRHSASRVPSDPNYVNTAPKGDSSLSLPDFSAGGRSPKASPTHSYRPASIAGNPPISISGDTGMDPVPEIGATYRALCDCSTLAPGCISFCQGDQAVLLDVRDQGWWKVNCNGLTGWVPASYWQKEMMLSGGSSMGRYRSHSATDLRHVGTSSPLPGQSSTASSLLNPHDLPTPSGRSSPLLHRGSTSTTSTSALQQVQKSLSNQVWFQGKISRKEAEECMMKDGNPCDFLVRESTHRVGDYALTVVYNGRVRHFPIEVTTDGKVLIGKHKFESIPKVIQHYKDCPLFIQDERHISLGHPYHMKRKR